MCFLCFFVWRLSMLAYRIEQSVSTMAADVKQMTTTGARLAGQVDELASRLADIEDSTSRLVYSEELTDFLASVVSLPETWSGGEARIEGQAAAEIAHLFACIGQPDLKYEYSGKHRSAAWVHLKLYNKYRLYRAGVASAEDFIEKVATKTVAGNEYYVIQEDGEKTPLGDWLLKTLREYRTSQYTGESDTAPESPAEAKTHSAAANDP